MRRNPMRSFLILFVAAFGGCAAFTDFSESPGREAVWRNSLATSPLTTEASSSTAMLAWGDTLIITAQLVNSLGSPVSVHFSNGCTSGYSLWSGDTMVYAPSRACTMAPVTRVYPSGRGSPYTISWVWNQDSIEPGAYRFRVGLGPTGEMDYGEVPIVLRAR